MLLEKQNKSSQQVKVLLVEDDQADQFLIRKRLEDILPHHNLESASSIAQAYNAHKKQNFDLILLDLNLPDGFGAKTVKRIRQYDQKIPIIVITGLGSNVAVSEALKLGANNVVLKSQIQGEDFCNIVQQNLHEDYS